jgi:hypothetical protein
LTFKKAKQKRMLARRLGFNNTIVLASHAARSH